MPVGAAKLPPNTAGQPLRNPEASAQGLNRHATPFRAQTFPVGLDGAPLDATSSNFKAEACG